MPKRHPQELRSRAAELRRAGVPRNRIAAELGDASSTVCRWFREDGVAAPASLLAWEGARQEAVSERWARQDAEVESWADEVGQLTPRELDLVAAALYWAEGLKSKPWRRSHVVQLCDMDPHVISVFLRWLHAAGVGPDRIRLQLAIHEEAQVGAAESWWRAVVGDGYRWGPVTYKRHNPLTRRKRSGEHYAGVLSIRVLGGAEVYRRLAGTWNGVAQGALP